MTLIFPDDYETFLHRIGQPEFAAELRAVAERLQDPALIANQPARPLQAASLPVALSVQAPGTTRVLIVLPGQSASCLQVALREGGQAFEADLASAANTAGAGP